MRSLIIGLVVFLAACNGSSGISQQTTNADIQRAIAPLSKALADATHAEAQTALAVSRLQVIGKVKGVGGLSLDAAGSIAVASFGPCADMGIYSGQGGTDSSNPLASQFEIYKQTVTGNCPGATTSYNEVTGLHDRLKFAAWDDASCGHDGGTMYVETDVPQNAMSLNALEGILVIMSPDPSDNTNYASALGSVPESIQIQSAFNISGGLCQSDIETRMVIPMVKNDFHITGVPDSLVPGSWSKVAP